MDTQDNIDKKINFNDSSLFPNLGKIICTMTLDNNHDKMESLRKFDNETTRLFKVYQKKKHLKNGRYRRVKPIKNNFDFDERSNSPDIFNAKDEQLKKFIQLNKHITQRARSNFRMKEPSYMSTMKKSTDKSDLKRQMQLLEQELFRC